ncbi:MAG: acetyl-CoA carboxylase biotin carboxyl carrier protein [Nitrospiraceae bacterium]|nr:acetyl-CoA carboxylase biotin carboxyl carrier protein [Nitrospiraceae bacterium]
MEIDDIKALLDLLKETDITELQLEKEGSKIKITRGRFYTAIEMPEAGLGPRPPAPPQIKHGEETGMERLVTVTAPLVGTFYRASSPEAPVFAEVSSAVKKGQVLCIVEAMKLMNEIESEIDGVVVKVLAENGQPVEYGEPLFLIEPSAP